MTVMSHISSWLLKHVADDSRSDMSLPKAQTHPPPMKSIQRIQERFHLACQVTTKHQSDFMSWCLSHMPLPLSSRKYAKLMHYFQRARSWCFMERWDACGNGSKVFMGWRNMQPVTPSASQQAGRGQAGSVPSSMCGGCFPQAEQPAWPQLSKPQALGEDEEEGGLGKEEGGSGGQRGGWRAWQRSDRLRRPGVWELFGKACAKCSETRYHLTARPPEGEEGCVPACGSVCVCVCKCVCVFYGFCMPLWMLMCALP